MESQQASLMVNCMLLALRKSRLYSHLANNNISTNTDFINVTSAFNYTTLDNQNNTANDSLDATSYNLHPDDNRNVYQ